MRRRDKSPSGRLIEVTMGVLVVLIIVVIVVFVIDYRECSARGGALVRGVPWMECVQPR